MLDGLKLIPSKIFVDDRGFFSELYQKRVYEEAGIGCNFVQDNLSFSRKGVLRGMHFQVEPGQAKLVSVLQGEIYDVVVDIRDGSPTFGEWEGVTLTPDTQFFIPEGFAHGFYVLSDQAYVYYKVSSYYNPAQERSFRFNDPQVNIQWPGSTFTLSARDQHAPFFEELFV